MRNSSVMVCCAAWLALPGRGVAQSFETMVQAELDAQRIGSSLSRKPNFGTGETRRHGAFDRAAPDVHLETAQDPEVAWFNPSIEIAGAKVSPDIKRKGLKVRIPVGDAQPGADDDSDD